MTERVFSPAMMSALLAVARMKADSTVTVNEWQAEHLRDHCITLEAYWAAYTVEFEQ